MQRKGLLWQLFPSFLLVTLLSLALVTAFASHSLRQFYFEQTAAGLQARAFLLENQVATLLAAGDTAAVQRTCQDLGKRTQTRLTVILRSGVVVADSQEDSRLMDNHADRQEIQKAFGGTPGTSTRFSDTLQQEMMYVAVPGGQTVPPSFVVRSSLSLATMRRALQDVLGQMVLAGLGLALFASLVSYGLSRRLSHSLRALKEGAERFAGGNLNHHLQAADSEEIGALADAMNTMAVQLNDRIKAVERQRNELGAVLASMVEGVLAVDTEETVISLNNAGARLLGLTPARAVGRSVQEVVRNPDLLALVQDSLSATIGPHEQPVERDIVLHGDQEGFLQAHASSLHGADHEKIGALVVLNDVTRLRRLETIRRDFVANVSHELRTPITSVKGFVETLRDNPPADAAERGHFLQIIAMHADRLNAIIEDLLSLSRVEQEAEKAEIALVPGVLALVARSAVAACNSATASSVRPRSSRKHPKRARASSAVSVPKTNCSGQAKRWATPS